MEKEISLQGIQRNSPDNQTADGTCQELVNLRYDSGAWRPVGTKKKWQGYGIGTSSFVHTVSDSKNKVCKYNNTIRWDKMLGIPNTTATEPIIATIGVKDVVRFDAIGNVLVIFNETTKTISWAVWSPERVGSVMVEKYHYVEQLPELPVFSFTTHKEVKLQEANGDIAYSGAAPDTNAEKQAFVKNHAQAYMAKKRREWYEKGWFDGYFYLVYAFELFDGTVVKHSNPISIYGGNLEMLSDELNYQQDSYYGKDTHLHLYVTYLSNMYILCRNVEASSLRYRLVNSVDLSPFRLLIKSINFYITPLVNIDYAEHVPSTRTSSQPCAYYPTHYKVDSLPSLNFEKQAGFYLVKRLPVDSMAKYMQEQRLSVNLNQLSAQPALPTDNSTHHRIYADANRAYNSRLFLGDMYTKLFKGWGLKYSNISGNAVQVFTRVILHTSEGVKTVDSELFSIGSKINLPLILSYPDTRAVRMDFFTPQSELASSFMRAEGQHEPTFSLPLKPHPTLNIAYAISPMCYDGVSSTTNEFERSALTMSKGDYLTSCLFAYSYTSSTPEVIYFHNDTLTEANRIQLSELNNPLYFPAKHSEYVGARVLGFSANTIPLSQGQFGQHPIFVFTQQGMWAMSIGVDPFIQTIAPVNGEVATDKHSIVNIGGATVFKTSEGLKLVEGSKVANLSDAVKLPDNPLAASPNSGFSHVTASSVIGLTSDMVSSVPFSEYLSKALIGYDTTLRELWICNPSYSFSYVLSMKYNYWFKVSTSGRELFTDYPSCYLVKGNDIFELSSESPADQQVLIQTRPLDLETHGFKKIGRTVLRGLLHTLDGSALKLGVYLFGSVDGIRWQALTGKEVEGMVRDVTLNRTLPSLKFLAVVASGRLMADSFISSITMDGEARLNGKLR